MHWMSHKAYILLYGYALLHVPHQICQFFYKLYRGTEHTGSKIYLCSNTWGNFFVASTLLSMDKTNAAVFPVPDCDWAIKFFGLNIKQNKVNIWYKLPLGTHQETSLSVVP